MNTLLCIVALLVAHYVYIAWVGNRIMRVLVDGKERSSVELRQRFGASAYLALHQLEEDEMVVGRWGETTSERAGRPRRYYRISEDTRGRV